MNITIDLAKKQDLTDTQIRALDSKLRTRITNLIGWAYSPLTGFLTLDFSDTEDNNMMNRLNDWMNKAEGKRLIRFEFLEMIKKW